LSALLQRLVVPDGPRSGFANVHLAPVRKGVPVTFGTEIEWKYKFSPEQLATAPLSLAPVLESNSVALLPGSSPEVLQGLRARGFSASRYDLTPEEFAWIVSMLPTEKAELWKRSGERTVTMVVCAGRVVVKDEGYILSNKKQYCEPPPGLKLEEVAPVEGGSILSNLRTAIGDGLRSVFQWAAPDSIQNAVIFSANSEPSADQRRQAELFVADYDRMAASVADTEKLVSLGAPVPREVAVRLQISKMKLAQSAQPVEQMRKAMGLPAPGSTNRKEHGRTRRNRSRDTYGFLPVALVAAAPYIGYAILAVSAAAAAYWLADAYKTGALEATKQVEASIKYRQDLLARCGDSTLPAAVRGEICKVAREEAKHPMAGSAPGPDWTKIAMWGGIGLLGIAGAVAVASLSSTAKPIVVAASQRMNRNREQPAFLEG
jgi:hypothetical protein